MSVAVNRSTVYRTLEVLEDLILTGGELDRSVADGDLQTVRDVSRRDVGIPVLVGVDQEGGAVQTLSGPGFPVIPSALDQGRWSKELLDAAGMDADPAEFRRYGSARALYNFHVDNASAY